MDTSFWGTCVCTPRVLPDSVPRLPGPPRRLALGSRAWTVPLTARSGKEGRSFGLAGCWGTSGFGVLGLPGRSASLPSFPSLPRGAEARPGSFSGSSLCFGGAPSFPGPVPCVGRQDRGELWLAPSLLGSGPGCQMFRSPPPAPPRQAQLGFPGLRSSGGGVGEVGAPLGCGIRVPRPALPSPIGRPTDQPTPTDRSSDRGGSRSAARRAAGEKGPF